MGRKLNTEIRGHILETAAGLFHEGGYRGVSMDDVAAKAGVKKANLFHYYKTKEELGGAVLDHACCCLKEKINAFFSGKTRDPIKAVERLFSQNEENMKTSGCCRGCFIGNLAQEMSDQNETLRVKISDYFDFWTLQLASFLERAKAQRIFKKEMDPKESAQAILALLEGATLFSKAHKKVHPFRNARKMAVAYLEGLRA